MAKYYDLFAQANISDGENYRKCKRMHFREVKKSNFGVVTFLEMHLIFSSYSKYLFACVLIKILNRFIINVDLNVFFP